MTQKRKAEIQRKLSLARVPDPPAGLAERIKADIPRHLLEPQAERARLQRWMTLSLRTAAAVLFLVTSTVALVQLFSDTEPSKLTQAAPPVLVRRPAGSTAPRFDTAVEPAVQTTAARLPEAFGRPSAGATVELTRQAASSSSFPAADRELLVPSPAAPPPPPRTAEQAFVSENVVAVAAPPTTGPAAAAAPSDRAVDVSESFAAAPAAASAPAARRIAAPDPISVAATGAATGSTSNTLFGISADPEAFGRMKQAIEAGERPSSTDVDVEALINYFAGAPKRPRRAVALQVEGSPAPVAKASETMILRFTIDTAAARGARAGEEHLVARDARIEIDLDANAIASYRRIGGADTAIGRERTLRNNLSVTGLYELELKPRLHSRQRIATVRLHYRPAAGGAEQTIERTLRTADFARPWMTATPRHRLASLGAVWGESLMSAAARATEVARKAEELAVKEPKDERAKELAEAATASSRL